MSWGLVCAAALPSERSAVAAVRELSRISQELHWDGCARGVDRAPAPQPRPVLAAGGNPAAMAAVAAILRPMRRERGSQDRPA
jgi:hypothetical protein